MITAALLLAAAAAPQQLARNWTQTVVTTPVGWRVGNPAARLKLVEYASPNCPHCAHYSEFATTTIMAAVKSGRASFEYRPYMIFPHDIAATLLARCVPAGRRFGFIESYYRQTGAFTDKLRAMDPKALEAAQNAGAVTLNRTFVSVSGMGQLAARHGVSPALANRCVADQAGMAWIQNALTKAKQAGVTGTPTFMLNGKRVQFGSAEELAALLK